MNDLVRVFVHAGFHKTGTTSLQGFLRENHHTLQPYLSYFGKSDFPETAHQAEIYARRRFPWRRHQFRRTLGRFLATIPDTPVIVLSCESFAGVMPGHRDMFGRAIQGYVCSSIPLAQDLVALLRARFGENVDIQFFYTTRVTEDWLSSAYGHLQRSIKLTQNFSAFQSSFDLLLDLGAEAQKIADALHPIPVHVSRLEDNSDHPEGPAAAILDLVGVPSAVRAKLIPAKRQNIGQDSAQVAQFLRLNRTVRNRKKLRAMKDQILGQGGRSD